jgi:hypothetical protein
MVMKCAHIGAVLNFDLCDLQKVGQIKNPGIMSCILIRCTYDKNLEIIQPLVQEENHRWPYLKSDQAKILKKVIWCLATSSHKIRML